MKSWKIRLHLFSDLESGSR